MWLWPIGEQQTISRYKTFSAFRPITQHNMANGASSSPHQTNDKLSFSVVNILGNCSPKSVVELSTDERVSVSPDHTRSSSSTPEISISHRPQHAFERIRPMRLPPFGMAAMANPILGGLKIPPEAGFPTRNWPMSVNPGFPWLNFQHHSQFGSNHQRKFNPFLTFKKKSFGKFTIICSVFSVYFVFNNL